MNVIAMLMADSRFPGGGHVHSGGLEEAAARGLIKTEEDLEPFLRNRLRTAGALAATFAAAAAWGGVNWHQLDEELDARTPSAAQRAASRAQGKATARAAAQMPTKGSGKIAMINANPGGYADRPPPFPGAAPMPILPAHTDKTPGQQGLWITVTRTSPSERDTRAIGSPVPPANSDSAMAVGHAVPAEASSPAVSAPGSLGLPASVAGGSGLQASPSGAAIPRDPVSSLLSAIPRPHHPLILGVVVGAAGGTPTDAALAAAYLSISGPASASVRLLGLDPLRVNAIVAALAADVTEVAEAAAAHRAPADLPAPGSPGLDLLAEEHDRHHREEVRLFVS